MTVENLPPANPADTGNPPPPADPNAAWVAPDWIKEAPAELQAVVKAKGYQTPLDVVKAYDHAQRAIGAEKIVLPKDGVWDADARAKLGIPEAPEGYKVTRPEMPDGVPYDDKFEAAMLPVAHKLGITPQQLNGLVEAVTQHRLGEFGALAQTSKQAREAAESELRTEYGAAYDAKVEQARRAIAFAGGDQLTQAIEAAGVGNNPAFIRAWAKVGAMLSEDKLKSGQGGSFAMTPDEARNEIAKINAQMIDANSPLMSKNHPEHEMVLQRLSDLHRMAAGGKA